MRAQLSRKRPLRWVILSCIVSFLLSLGILASLRVHARRADFRAGSYFAQTKKFFVAGSPPLSRRRFIPDVSPPNADEPLCGAPSPRAPVCEAWCASSPFAPFLRAGRGCWESSNAVPMDKRDAPRRILLYTGYNGLADSLAGAMAAYYLAVLAGAEFHMRFSDGPSDPSFLWAFEPNCIDTLSATWSTAGRAPFAGDGFPLQRTHHHFDIFHMPDSFLSIVRGGDVGELWAGNEVLSLQTHVGFTHHLLRNPRYARRLAAAGITEANAFAEAYHFLLRPRAVGLHRFRKEIAALTDPSTLAIGIHVRTGVHYDKAFEPGAPTVEMSDFAPFFLCADRVGTELLRLVTPQLGSQPPRVRWFLLSDSVPLRENAARLIPEQLIARTAGVDVRHSRTSTVTTPVALNSTCGSFLDAAMEHWLFGLADAFVVTQWSGFGRTGALLHASVAYEKPIFQLSASKPERLDCSLRSGNVATLEDILEHPPGI